jgi:predicted homoserine dehydrogenase-like protein
MEMVTLTCLPILITLNLNVMSQTPKNIAILGSTGSIGRNSLSVIHNLSNRFCITYLSTNTNIELLQSQIAQFKPRGVVVLDETKAAALRTIVGDSVEVLTGREGLLEIVRRDDVDIVVNSLVGFAGLKPTIEAIKHRKNIALANKETLVIAGKLRCFTSSYRQRTQRHFTMSCWRAMEPHCQNYSDRIGRTIFEYAEGRVCFYYSGESSESP